MAIDMSVASASMTMAQADVLQQTSVSLLKKTMETQEAQSQQLLEMLPRQAASFGHKLDVYI